MPQKSKIKLPPLNLGKETLGKRIARLRKEKGCTQSELAQRIGIIRELISNYELRNNLTNRMLEKNLQNGINNVISLILDQYEKYFRQ